MPTVGIFLLVYLLILGFPERGELPKNLETD